MQITLKVTAKGQVTLRKEVLDHLKVRPGDKLNIELLPSGRVQASSVAGQPISKIFGLLKTTGQKPKTLKEINEAIADGWTQRP